MLNLNPDGRVYYRADTNSLPGGLGEGELKKDEHVAEANLASDGDTEFVLPDVPPPTRAASLAPIDKGAMEAAGIGARPRNK